MKEIERELRGADKMTENEDEGFYGWQSTDCVPTTVDLQQIRGGRRKRRVELLVNLQCERRNNTRMVRLNQP